MAYYHLEVYGRAWGGFRAVYQYTVTKERADAMIADGKPSGLDAGDFESIIDWRLVEETNMVERTKSPPITRRVDTFRTLRGFRAGMTPKRFYCLANR